MKKLILIILLSQSTLIFSQRIGAKIGAGINYTSKIITIPNFGINYEQKLGKTIALNTELNIIYRSYSSIIQIVN